MTARVTNSNVNEKNRMSKGRMELAMLVGEGDQAATLNAAMHRLGAQVCLSEEPACEPMPAQAGVPERVVLTAVSDVPASIAPGPLDPVGDDDWVLVLPRSDDAPSRLMESFIGASVPGDVGVELGSPPVSVRLGRDGVLGTAMPEAPVDKDGDPGSGEGDVGTTGKGREVHPVAETAAMQLPAQRPFGLAFPSFGGST